MREILTQAALLLLLPLVAWSQSELCVFTDDRGVIQQVQSKDLVPEEHRAGARCFQSSPRILPAAPIMAAPKEVELGPLTRSASLLTDLGSATLRWPRSAEALFGRTPERALADAARSVSRALAQSSFPPQVKNLRPEWQIVFMDATLPETQIPEYLRLNCHPGWMLPPGQIYIVAQRIAGVCGPQDRPRTSQVADAELSRVLIHEFGHAVEAAFFGGYIPPDRRRAEGFATWFESFAADFSSVIPRGQARQEHFQMARSVFPAAFSRSFNGSGPDYAAASLLFHAVVERRGTAGLARVYRILAEQESADIIAAIRSETGWNDKRLLEEMGRVLEK
jgi:hypothetical protein